MATKIFYAFYTQSEVGVTGLTVTVDIHRINKATGAHSEVVTAGVVDEIGDGAYMYLLASADLSLYDYIAIFKTATLTVDRREMPSLWSDYGCAPNSGAIEFTYTVTDPGLSPIEGVDVWITTDIAGNNVIWSGVTDAFGVARTAGGNLPWLDAGTYYFWSQKTGYDFTNPDTEVVT
jgi:hypothetical protein